MSLVSLVVDLADRIADEVNTLRSTLVPSTRTVAGQPLSADVTLEPGDVGFETDLDHVGLAFYYGSGPLPDAATMPNTIYTILPPNGA